jgi:hypothetical protein
MKRVLVLAIIVLAILAIPPIIVDSPLPINDVTDPQQGPNGLVSISSAGSIGNDINSLLEYTREIQDLDFALMNSFSNTTAHPETVDFSAYHIAGWSLYEVLISTSRVVAQSEHEVVGSSSSPSNAGFRIYEHDPPTSSYYDQLAQGFYNMGHDGKLENVSMLYDTPSYDPVNQKYAYFDIRSDYQDGSTNMVSSVQLDNVGLTATWTNVTESAILDADTTYYVVLNGSTLIEYSSVYPEIRWFYEDDAGSYLTRRHNTEGDSWGSDRPFEAILNYTYIPWNTTSDSALEFQNPLSLALQGNSSALSGSDWLFSSTSNVSQVQFSSNQSISIEYDLTLRYKQNISSKTTWFAGSSGTDVTWNITSIVNFPELSGSQDKNLTLVLPDDWTVNHLFNLTTPTQYYDHFSQEGSSVECTLLADETWVLECTSPNYLQSISKFDSSDDSTITDKVSVSVTMDINATIESAVSDPATNGEASLRVFYQSSVEYAENFTVTAGTSHHQWDISSHSSSNGLHTIDLYWMNGTEAGYRTSDVFVYYETTFAADEYSIDAFTENTFYIGIDFNQIFPIGGIDSSAADVTYSFGAVVNQSLDDQSNGRWDATVSTVSMTPATYDLHIYAEGYALENKSLTIQITLIHETETLAILWSNDDNISYVGTTELSIGYNRVGGIPIPTASVNVTIGVQTWQLPYDSGSETFKITFNGTDDFPGFGTFAISIDAGLVGYESQSNYSQTFTLYREPTEMTTDWSNGRNITYIEYTTLTVNYTMSNGTSVENAWINITINGRTLLLHENVTDGTYYLRFNGSDATLGFGEFSFTISAWKEGYVSKTTTVQTLTLREVSTLFDATWVGSSTITYVESTILSINYTMIDGTPVTSATVWVTIDGAQWVMAWDVPSQTYRKQFNGDDDPPGLEIHSLSINASKLGHENHTSTSLSLTIEIEPTSVVIEFVPSFSINYTGYTTLFVDYLMSDSSPISEGYVTITIGGELRQIFWNGARYQLRIDGNDTSIVFGPNFIVIQASNFGFAFASSSDYNITLSQEPTSMVIQWSNGSDPGFYEYTVLSVEYTYNGGLPVLDAIVNVTIGTYTWDVVWNNSAGNYQIRFNGSDSNPGVGTHSLVIRADRYGFVLQTKADETLVLPDIPTILTIEWTNSSSITYVETTTLLVKYRMYNDTVISTAYVEITIGTKTWILNWSDGFQAYELTFDGSDNPPGFGTHQIFIDASETDFIPQASSSNYVTLNQEPTSLLLQWWLSDTITYVGQTVLYANFTMSNGSAIVGAYVSVAIGSTNKTFVWNATSKVYSVILSGMDPGYILGVHSVTIQATLFGFEQGNDNTQTLTVQSESTTLTPSWIPDNNITYFESTTLIVRYEMSNETPITGAVVNITIDTDVWTLNWNASSKAYEYTFTGSDNLPGYGDHSIQVRASKYGYESIIDSTQQLTIRLEDTIISFEWDPSSTITYVGGTKIIIFYQMANGTPILGATVNITRGPSIWVADWNNTSQAYEYSWLGTDDPPGLGSHLLLIKAWKDNYVGIVDISQTLTINEEPTQIFVSWSAGNNITYVQSTTLFVNYTTSGGVVIANALVDVTIGTDNWILSWNITSKLYEITFSGSDSPPGLDTHSLSIRGWQFGYETAVDASETLVLREEPTTMTLSWSAGNTITYVGSTTLSVRYEMSSGDPVTGANVNITIGTDNWILSWNVTSKLYEITFSGSDDPPGLGTHPITIQASNWGFQYASNSSESLTITKEQTSFVITWSSGDNITYVSETTLSVRYLMDDATNITGAILNVTINGNLWPLVWNTSSNAYEVTIRGDDNPPGYGTYSVEIRASLFGFVSIVDTTQEFTIRLEDTTVSFVWYPSNTITFTGQTRISISYLMSDGDPIEGATVNITSGITWTAIWNGTSHAYEYTWLGTDDPPGLGSHILSVQAWKVNYVAILNTSQILTITEEPTLIQAYWTDGNTITFVQFTTLQVNYTASDGSAILDAIVDVTIGTDNWILTWNVSSNLYEIRFNGSDSPPGLGTYGLSIRGVQFGYETTVNITMTLTISGELGRISSELLEGSTISFVGYTTLAVNYTMSNGTAIPLAIVNVTISGTLWNLTWHPASATYRIQFNGTDIPPGFGIHNLDVRAFRAGFDGVRDTTQVLTIAEEGTSLDIYWGAPNLNNVTYFDYTVLYAEYKMSNGTVIRGAEVNITIGSTTWTLEWNSTQGAYSLRFNGSDAPPGLGTHSLTSKAYKFGFEHLVVPGITLILSKDPTTLGVSWIGGNNITYVEHTTLSVNYKMSNGSDILGAVVNATIDGNTWLLTWNATAGAYQVQFTGNQNPPGLDSFTVLIHASADVYVTQSDTTSLTIQTENTTATQSWSMVTFDWTESVIFSVDFSDSYGSLIYGATTKSVYINGTEYVLLGTNGTYWIEFDNTFDLGLHNVWANFSKFGYDSAATVSITFTITEATTDLTIVWSSAVIDYLEWANLTVDYYYVDSGTSVPSTGVQVNITIDGGPAIPLTLQGNLWIANLTGVSLDLGAHNIQIRAWVYGYAYSETLEVVTVNEITTDPLVVTWSPSNVTIEYTDLLNLTVDYTYYGGDVPGTAIVNVSIDGRLYALDYSGGLWRVSIPGIDLGIGLRTATINALLYGYAFQTDITANINVTEAANTFSVTWEPLSLDASYIDIVNASVTYTQDYQPIVGATVQLTINGTPYILAYDAIDEVWHFSMLASDIGLGMWNVTVAANKTGYADGWNSFILSISPASTNLTVVPSAVSIYYDEDVTFAIYYELLHSSYVPGATLTLEVDGIAQVATWDTDHWTFTRSGSVLGLGTHPFYIHVVAFGFEVATNTTNIDVIAIPTTVTTGTPSATIFAYETTTISFIWTDDKNLVDIAGFVPVVTWPDAYSVVDHGNGTYTVAVHSLGLHVGNYELHVDFVRTGYVSGSQLVNIEIVELPIALVFDSEIEQFENETIMIVIQVYDGPHATVVDWAEIIIELEGIQYILHYDSGLEQYFTAIWLDTLAPGSYTINFTVTAVDCETEFGEVQLEIVPKVRYYLTLDVDEDVTAGQPVEITVSASYESGVVDGFPVTVHIVIVRGDSAPQEITEDALTNTEGVALVVFNVPSDATVLTIWADFVGAEGEWPAISNTVNREVSPGGFDILSFIFSLFEDPITLTIIVGGGGGSIAGLILLRRRRGVPKVSKPMVTDTIAPPTTAPTAPAGEMESVQNVIKENPNGMTRAQIAQSLEISTSKASAMVRKLLESNSMFEEVKEGRLSRIRFIGEV